MLTSRDQLILTNEGDHDLLFRWDGQVYGVPAGSSVHVPFDVIRKEFGDPRSGEQERVAIVGDGREKIRIASRASELRRLEQLYGLGAKRTIEQRPVTLAEVAPKVRVTTVDGDPVETVVSDPRGASPLAIPVDLDSPEALSARVAQMQRELDQTAARLEASLSQHDADSDPADDTTPDGTARARPARAGAR